MANWGVTLMRTMTFTIEGSVNALVTVSEVNGDLVFDLQLTSDNGTVGDLRALFFDVSDETLLAGLTVSGAQVTDSAFQANSVTDLGQSANIQGEVVETFDKFDAGVEFGTAGISKDDIRSTQFTLSHSTMNLTLDLLSQQDFGIRITSVGTEGVTREGSLKLGGEAGEAPPLIPTFSRTDYATGPGPISVAINDVNGDGNKDLVVANGNSFSTDSVLLGNGDGTFQGETSYVVGESHEVLTADVNGDGKLDLVNANSNSGTVSISLGNGDGTFGPRTAYYTGGLTGSGAGPLSVDVGDVNGDGKTDLVAANSGADTVGVLLGNGDGTFGAPTTYATGDNPHSIEAVDLDGDGRIDLATANFGASSVSVLLGNGDGTFQAQVQYGTGGSAQWVESGDVNGDGRLDLLALNGSSNGVSVLLGNGDGTFQASIDSAAGPSPFHFATGDLNGDGDLDLVTANINHSSMSLLLGNGDGTFQAPIDYQTGFGPTSVGIDDVNGDGRDDIMITNGGDNDISVFLNTSGWLV